MNIVKVVRKQTNTTNVRHYFTLWIKRPSCIKTHNVITDNCKKIRLTYQRFDSISEQRLERMPELKAVLEMTTARPDISWKTATPLTHSCSNDDVTQLVAPLVSDFDAIFEAVEISDCDACFTL